MPCINIKKYILEYLYYSNIYVTCSTVNKVKLIIEYLKLTEERQNFFKMT